MSESMSTTIAAPAAFRAMHRLGVYPRQARLGFIYTLCVPALAGIATVRQVSVGGFNYSGFLWVVALVIGWLLLLIEKGLHPERRLPFFVWPWWLWLMFLGLSFAWLEHVGYAQLQYALQLGMPFLVGAVAAQFDPHHPATHHC